MPWYRSSVRLNFNQAFFVSFFAGVALGYGGRRGRPADGTATPIDALDRVARASLVVFAAAIGYEGQRSSVSLLRRSFATDAACHPRFRCSLRMAPRAFRPRRRDRQRRQRRRVVVDVRLSNACVRSSRSNRSSPIVPRRGLERSALSARAPRRAGERPPRRHIRHAGTTPGGSISTKPSSVSSTIGFVSTRSCATRTCSSCSSAAPCTCSGS